MKETISVSPVTRIEGHLGVKIETDNGRVTSAHVVGEMFRGFEQILRGRDPLDAQQVTQRICGVCPVEHGIASVLAQDAAYGITPPTNGRILRNLAQAANFITSHITHFYLLSGLDFVDVAQVTTYTGADPALVALRDWAKSEIANNTVNAGGPFLPQFPAQLIRDPVINLGVLRHYLEAIEIRRDGHKLGALFLGKLPHAAALIPGGVTEKVSAILIVSARALLARLRTFIEQVYLPDVITVAGAFPAYFDLGRGRGDFLSFGVFPENDSGSSPFLPAGVLIDGKLQSLDVRAITEDVRYSWYSSASGRRPTEGETVPAPDKSGAYSWLKAPRYAGRPLEVGPLARLLVAYQDGRNTTVKSAVDGLLKAIGRGPADLNSVLGRHATRALESKLLADRCAEWLDQLVPDQPTSCDFTIPATGSGVGLTEAARGALGHWIEIKDHKIANYQCVVPTTWNCSPRDDRDQPGPMEQSLIGTPVADAKAPIEAARVIRSFDPCLACAVH
ncbi:MAG: nickel-dependent hydrogenase large subunit [Opitutaceae bacterium]|nr:nickel-dependent hydrogenase large subunit [Opitutaceae bacterium]